MKNIKEYILEASRNAKQRNLDFSKKMFINGKSYNNISSFAIMTAENPDSTEASRKDNKRYMKELSDLLKRQHYVYIQQEGHYEGNVERSYIIFNIKREVVAKFSGMFEQTSFSYCYSDGTNIVNEYWGKQDKDAKYDSISNPYIFINKTSKVHNEKDAIDFYSVIDKDFKYSIDCEVFDKAEAMLESVIDKLKDKFNLNESNSDILDYVYNKIDFRSNAYKKFIVESLGI